MTLTIGAKVQFDTPPINQNPLCVTFSTSQGAAIWRRGNNDFVVATINYDAAQLITSIGPLFNLPNNDGIISDFIEIDTNKFIILRLQTNGDIAMLAGSVSGDTVALGEEVVIVVPGDAVGGAVAVKLTNARYTVYFGQTASGGSLRGLVCTYIGVEITNVGLSIEISPTEPGEIAALKIGTGKMIVSFFEDVFNPDGFQLVVEQFGDSLTPGPITEFAAGNSGLLDLAVAVVDSANILRTYNNGSGGLMDLVRLSGATTLTVDQSSVTPNDNLNVVVNTNLLAVSGLLDDFFIETSITVPTFSNGPNQAVTVGAAGDVSRIDTSRTLCTDRDADSYILASDLTPVVTDWDLSQSPKGIPGRDTT